MIFPYLDSSAAIRAACASTVALSSWIAFTKTGINSV
jgi:hypothetical protein